MRHEQQTETLESPPDIFYLLQQLDENEFLGAMKTKRIIRYTNYEAHTAVETWDFPDDQ